MKLLNVELLALFKLLTELAGSAVHTLPMRARSHLPMVTCRRFPKCAPSMITSGIIRCVAPSSHILLQLLCVLSVLYWIDQSRALTNWNMMLASTASTIPPMHPTEYVPTLNLFLMK